MGKWKRRAFMTTGVLAGGAVIFGVAIRPGNQRDKVAHLLSEEGEVMMNIWLKIAPDNVITAYVPHAEMGQGVLTALGMMVAEELDADWGKMRIVEAPPLGPYASGPLIKGFLAGDKKFPAFFEDTVNGVFLTAGKLAHMQLTGGSASVRFTGQYAMRTAGAATRSVLVKAASQQWNVPEEELSTSMSIITHAATGRSAPYAEFAALATQFDQADQPNLKPREKFTLIGTSPTRLDLPAKVDGSAQYGIDVRLPNMKFAAIQMPPVFGSEIIGIDYNGTKEMEGVQKILEVATGVAVVADSFWTAQKALKKLKISYSLGDKSSLQQDDIYALYSNVLDSGKFKRDKKVGDFDRAASEAHRQLSFEYQIPFLAHACMEPMNCTVWVQENQCDIWTGSQNPLGFVHEASKLLDIDKENINLHNQLLGGGFGRRAESDVLKQAVEIAKEVNYPVQLIWSRENCTQHDVYREANIARFNITLDQKGKATGWNHQFLFKHHPKEAPYIPYGVENQKIEYTSVETPVPWGNWRSVDHSMHGFFIESCVDEIAHHLDKDPYIFRQELLARQPRFLKVLNEAARRSGWTRDLPEHWGRGIAVHASFGTVVAEVVEVEVGEDGTLDVQRVVCVADPGFAVHEDGFKAQMESGILYGLTAALYGEITIEDGAVRQSNFHDYQMLRMGEIPVIETYIVESDAPLGGAGEPSTPVIAPALVNAIFDATGKRLRNLPVKNYDLSRAALLG